MTQQPTRNSIDPEMYATAMAVYETDKSLIDRANGQKRRHQNYFETEYGISGAEVRRRYKESKMTEGERLALYAEEQIGRRALNLWDADSEEDFNELMSRAAATEPASGEGARKLEKARAYNAGFNGAVHGNQSRDDNPYAAGDELNVDWDRGCREGLEFKEEISLEAGLPRQADRMQERMDDAAPEDAPDAPAKRKRGRPAGSGKKSAAAKSLDDLKAAKAKLSNGHAEAHDEAPPALYGEDSPEAPLAPAD